MPNRKLIAYINDDPIGELSEESGLWSFRYTSAWLSNPHRYALSPYLPLEQGGILDGGTSRPVQWYFDNLLPEEGQRVLLANQARTDIADAFALLAFYGAESAGSVTLLDEAKTPSNERSLTALTDETLSMRIHRMPKVPLTQGAVKRMSLAGAQHKLAVVYQDGVLFEPDGATPSTHILKPNHPSDDYPHSVINEWFVMRLAKRVGLVVPEVHRKYVPEPVYIIDRFDRHHAIDQWQRLHVIDACSPVAREQKAEVEAVLREIGADDIPRIEVMNKIDQMPQTFTEGAVLVRDSGGIPSQVFLSAKTGLGLDLLRSALAECSQMTDRIRVEQNRAKVQMAPDEFLAPLPERPETSEFNPIPNRKYSPNDA